MLSVIDVLELIPRTDCGKCSFSTCMNTAKKIAAGEVSMLECSVMAKDPAAFKELAELIAEDAK